ncbi:MAG: hypothetical protein Q9162_005030 [Coniocarpon cinnabarinum]
MDLISSVDDQHTSDDFAEEPSSSSQPTFRRSMVGSERRDFASRGQGTRPAPSRRTRTTPDPRRKRDDRKRRPRNDSARSSDRFDLEPQNDQQIDPDEAYLEEYRHQFHSEAEGRGYERVFFQTRDLLARRKQIASVLKKPEVRDNPNGEMAKRCEQQMRELDDGIRDALQSMQDAKNQAYVPHQPAGVDLPTLNRSKLGGAATGDGGVGNATEDAVRYLAHRPEHVYRDPKLLARRQVSGEFMKFQDHTERRRVQEALQNLAHEEKQPEWKKAGFAPLEPEARREAVRRMVAGRSLGVGPQEGRLVEAGKMAGPGDVLEMARRLAGSQYRGEQTEMLLKGIGELLPQGGGQRPGQQRQQKQAET